MSNYLLDFINPYYLAGRLPDAVSGTDSLPFFAESKFPNKKTENSELQFVKGYKTGSRLAPLAEFDANYSRKGREGYSKISEEIPFIRYAKGLTEKEKIDIRSAYATAQALGNSEYLTSLWDDIFADAPDMIRDINATRELMRFQILQNNGIDIASTDYNGNIVNYKASFDVAGDPTWSSTHTISASTAWENAGATPMLDLLNAIEFARKTNNTVITEIVPSVRLWNALLTNENDREQLSIFGITPAAITSESVSQWISAKSGITVTVHNPLTYNTQYTDYAGNTQEYLNANTCLLLPGGTIGTTLLSPTPAEQEKRENPNLRVALTDDRIAVHTVAEQKEPFTYDTVVSARTVPTGEGMDNVFKITVPASN